MDEGSTSYHMGNGDHECQPTVVILWIRDIPVMVNAAPTFPCRQRGTGYCENSGDLCARYGCQRLNFCKFRVYHSPRGTIIRLHSRSLIEYDAVVTPSHVDTLAIYKECGESIKKLHFYSFYFTGAFIKMGGIRQLCLCRIYTFRIIDLYLIPL